jgi:hypothetical protein
MTDQVETQQAAPAVQDLEVTLTLKISAVNTILASLDEIPHKFSRAIIDSIVGQAQPQLQATAPVAE